MWVSQVTTPIEKTNVDLPHYLQDPGSSYDETSPRPKSLHFVRLTGRGINIPSAARLPAGKTQPALSFAPQSCDRFAFIENERLAGPFLLRRLPARNTSEPPGATRHSGHLGALAPECSVSVIKLMP